MVWPKHVAKKIDTLRIFPHGHFLRMQIKAQLLTQKFPHRRQQIPEHRFIVRDNDKIIGVPNVVFDSEPVLHECIKLVHVHVRKKLGR